MNIQEATKKAMKNGGLIYRESTRDNDMATYGAIKPTNTYDTCILAVIKGDVQMKSCRAWNPTAEDLIADDWEVIKV